ncbi:MAG: enoyl-CoA hydratase/isomerase family protein [Burkholderiales bacterium]|nr:enoyl-CoA hydratase/isomerase family protein [Burkholderiales bacterium]
MSDIVTEVRGSTGFITLNRPRALNALSLPMIRDLTAALLAWRDDAGVERVAIRGQGKEGPFGVFCAGGDIRFFHVVALAGDPALEDFFTEEYTLNHLVHTYPKPFVAFMDGIVMGGGMGISQGASLRIVTERTKVAMPETSIGLFPDVGGGWFLGRCPGRMGEYLALTGQVIDGAQAVAAGLADRLVPSHELPGLWQSLEHGLPVDATETIAAQAQPERSAALIDRYFSLESVPAIVAALEADGSPWAAEKAALLRKRSPLMLHVTLEQVRRARAMTLADDLRMERGLMRHCFHLRPGTASETVEGIRALVIDKDQNPKWNPARIEDVTPEMVAPYFASPWPAHAHPLRGLA